MRQQLHNPRQGDLRSTWAIGIRDILERSVSAARETKDRLSSKCGQEGPREMSSFLSEIADAQSKILPPRF